MEIFGNGYFGATGNNVCFHDSNGSSFVNCLATEINLSPQTWFHLVVTDSLGVINIYINGTLMHACSNGLGIPTNIDSSICIGKTTEGGGFFFNGTIDEVRIYNRAFTDAEVQELYNHDNPKCSTWADVISKYNSYVSGQADWSEVITCYNQYVSP